jgi:hypothetical protein
MRSCNELIVSDVYEALESTQKMKGMVHVDGLSSKGYALQVKGRPEQRSSNEAKKAEFVQSPDHPRIFVSIAKRTRSVGKIILMVRHLLSSVLVQILEIV